MSEDEVHVPPPRQKQKARQVFEVQRALASSQLVTALCDKEVNDQQQQTAAQVAAAAGVVAAAAALQVIQAAGEHVEAQLQVHTDRSHTNRSHTDRSHITPCKGVPAPSS